MEFQPWIQSFYDEAKAAGDRPRVQLALQAVSALETVKSDPRQADALLKIAQDMAEKIQEKCWLVVLAYFRADLHTRRLSDLPGAVRIAAQMVVEARKPEYAHCPWHAELVLALLMAYLYIDPVGYAPQIEDSLRYVEENFELNAERQHEFYMQRTLLEFVRENYEAAKQIALQALAHAGNTRFMLCDVYVMIAEVMYRLKDYQSALMYTQLGIQLDRGIGLVQFLGYQAVYLLKLGEVEAAEASWRRAQMEAQRLPVEPYFTFYEAISIYHELSGELEEAITACRRLIQATVKTGSIYAECEARNLLCRLLGKAGQPFEQEAEAVRTATRQLVDPRPVLRKLDRVLQGDYSDD